MIGWRLSAGSGLFSQWTSRWWKTYVKIEREDERAERDEDALAQLVQMLDERRLLAVLEAAR